jgi:MFS superfamily sulfate permease-like transporter
MYIPESVIQGFTVGVAFIIFINQIAGGMALRMIRLVIFLFIQCCCC